MCRSGLVDYAQAWREMRAYTDLRTPASPDRIWLLQHHSVFTQGQAGRSEHLLDPGAVPVVQSDRGGQVTWHGPGQCVAYLMLDIRRLGIGVRELVDRIEAAVIGLLAGIGIVAAARREAPGVYVEGAKIAALGLRVRRGCSYHGLSLNVDADLAPFARINPCGYPGLAVTRIVDRVAPEVDVSMSRIEQLLLGQLLEVFAFDPKSVREVVQW
ncbi:MAG: lipoyl(octanoyl) transferase LipB [Gammaproteobacteria bacterium]|nr:lipoyl(octanoyl) transferase LipB [Gammaproteobacteria bacterium]MBP6052381.1 lipoyl(octanoyl) transferase LipB [Pseudomonadales bacterium]MBK6584831.1 lipoyl(octanoyl) transferase LipB [Gammaproteobacteria bacterium]MBK7170006.1 lipoyl(octanoyl) transferase LipB [Gammaproteobacteria bacterium]MBK7519659.1 lipoyl(octanoyl) transferase LipB [Gammaproteobacteria bacterium]